MVGFAVIIVNRVLSSRLEPTTTFYPVFHLQIVTTNKNTVAMDYCEYCTVTVL